MAKRNTPGASRRTPVASAGTRSTARRTERVVDLGPDIPRWVAPLVFAAMTVLLFPEVFFKGNTLFGHDTLGLSYFARNFYTQFVHLKHAFPLWDPMLLGGLPFLEGMHGDIFYPPSIALFFLPASSMWAWKMVLHVFLAGLFAYIWLRRGMKLRRGPAMVGALFYMMGAEMVTLVLPGGDGKLFVSALAPLMFWLTERAAAGRRLSDFAAFALGIALIILTSHMQLAYFCIWGVTFYFFFRVWEIWRAERDGGAAARLIGMFALAGILGVGAAAIQFLPPLHYLKTTSVRVDSRSDPSTAYEEATSYSLHPEEVMSLVVPEFIGASDNGTSADGQFKPLTYWGRNGLKLNHEYVGLIALLLVPIMFLRRRRPIVWFFGGLSLFALVFAVGATTPFFHLFMLIPGVKLFRAPSLIMFLFGLSVSTLAAMAVQRVLEWRDEDGDDVRAVTRYMWIALGVMAFIALLGASGVLTAMWRSSIYDPASMGPVKAANLEANAGRMKLGFLLAFAFTGLLVAWWTIVRRRAVSATQAILLVAALGAIDLYRTDRPFVVTTAKLNDAMKQTAFFKPDAVIDYLQKQAADPKHVFRAAVWSDPNTGAMAYGYSRNQLAIHGIEQAAGLHGNEIGRYMQLIGDANAKNAFENYQLLNLLNVEYLVFPGKIRPMAELTEVAGPGFNGATVYRNSGVWPRAFLVGHATVMNDTAAFAAVAASKIDLRTNVIVAESAPELSQLNGEPIGTVDWTERSPNRLRLHVTTDKPAMLVVSDNYYEAWKATVGGKPATVHRVDYTFRGVVVPAGTSDVELYYSTDHLRTAAMTSIVLLLLLLGVFVGGLLRGTDAVDVIDEDQSAA